MTARVDQHTIHAGWNAPSHGTFTGFEHYVLDDNLSWDFYGSNAPETVEGGAYFRLHAWTYGGNDDVTGSLRNDRIDTGAGTDTVSGREGRDTCLNAEHVYDCERLTP